MTENENTSRGGESGPLREVDRAGTTEMPGFVEPQAGPACPALLSRLGLCYCSFRDWLTSWRKKSYKNLCDSHFHSFLAWCCVATGQHLHCLKCYVGIDKLHMLPSPFLSQQGAGRKLKSTFPRLAHTSASGCGLEAASQTHPVVEQALELNQEAERERRRKWASILHCK